MVQLTAFTDYTLRALIFLGAHPDNYVDVPTIAAAFEISRQHLSKVAQHLVALELVESKRGNRGGLRLVVAPESINVGELVRDTEPNLDLLECFDDDTNTCPIAGPCRLQRALQRARTEFFAVLDEYTLADLLSNRRQLIRRLPQLAPTRS